jgi:thioredoxin 1
MTNAPEDLHRGNHEREDAMNFVNSIAAERFAAAVAEADLPVIVEFYSPECSRCKRLAPFLEELAEKYAGRAQMVRVNVEEEPDLALIQGIRQVPTVLVFQRGGEVDRVEGLMSPYQLLVKMEQFEELAHPVFGDA